MNRRALIGRGLGVVAMTIVGGTTIASNASAPHQPLCDRKWCGLFLETTARQNIEETKKWKADALRDRGDSHSLFTFYGCCGVEATPPTAKNAEWTFQRRNLTLSERDSFHREYGQQAPLLLCVDIGSGARIRGFVLNGRTAGWNLSTCLVS